MNLEETQSSVGIVIPCYQEAQYIRACVTGCLNQTGSFPIQVYVVDGGSTDQTRSILLELQQQYSNLHVLDNPHKTTPHALNIGLKHSSEHYKMILGAHACLPEDYVEKCLRTFEHHPEAACVGGLIENQFENESSAVIGLAMSSPFGVGNAHFRTGAKSGFVDTVAFGMYKKEVFERIGYFNEELARNQDDEFNFRLTQNQGKIFLNTDLSSQYFVRSSYSKLYRQYYQYGYWKVYVNVLHRQVTTVRQLFPAFLVLYVALLLPLLALPILPNWLVLLPALSYVILGLYFGLKKSATQVVSVLITFGILHFSYGTGYLKGIWDFIVLKNKPSSTRATHNR
jgi:glycosyltransferase involved in cell wall biosynthesis